MKRQKNIKEKENIITKFCTLGKEAKNYICKVPCTYL